jgi:hypothetical protein
MKNVFFSLLVGAAVLAAAPAMAADANGNRVSRNNVVLTSMLTGAVVGGVAAAVLCPPCSVGTVALTSLGAVGVGVGVGAGTGLALAYATNRGSL